MALIPVPRPSLRRVEIRDITQAGEVRRAIDSEARSADFDETQRGRAAIAATEIATNIARHTSGGEVLFGLVEAVGGPAMEIFGIDQGPGMAEPDRCLADGYSSRSTPGNGLGAVRRQSDEFDLYSTVQSGTVILARVLARAPAKTAVSAAPQFGAVSVPYPEEAVCGDAWRFRRHENGYAVLVADGLGHGVLAGEAAAAAVEAFDESPFDPPAEVVERIHARMQGTRGGTVAVANFHSARETLSYSGIGNISGRIVSSDGSRGLISVNGTAGATVRKVQQFEYDCAAGSTLVMHSDGLQSRWDAAQYPGILSRHPAMLAGVLYRDQRRLSDDVSVVAMKWKSF